jgi:hypothetical protein
MLLTHIHLCLSSGLFASGFLFPHIYATCSPLTILLDFVILTIFTAKYKLRSSLQSFLNPPVTSSLHSSNVFLSTLFYITLSLSSFLDVSDQASHPQAKL